MNPSRAEDPLLELGQYREYLKVIAELQWNPRWNAKEGASDIVQQTMLEAHRDMPQFRGKTDAELKAWLRVILTRNLLSVHRRYNTQKRATDRELVLDNRIEQSSNALCHQLEADQTSPSMAVVKREQSELVANALLNLLEDERTSVVLKHFHDWTVAEIACHLTKTEASVAGLLRRGLKKLREELLRDNT